MKMKLVSFVVSAALFICIVVGFLWHWPAKILVLLGILFVGTRVCFYCIDESRRKASYELIAKAYEPVETFSPRGLYEQRQELLTVFYARVAHHLSHWPDDLSGRMKLFRSLYNQAMID